MFSWITLIIAFNGRDREQTNHLSHNWISIEEEQIVTDQRGFYWLHYVISKHVSPNYTHVRWLVDVS